MVLRPCRPPSSWGSDAAVPPPGSWAAEDFETVLGLISQAADDDARLRRATTDQLLSLLETLDGMPEPGPRFAYVPVGALGRLYAAEGTSRTAGRTPPKSDQEAVAAELRLNPLLTVDDLKRLRRLYAAANHPDRVPPAQREQATRRMTIANMLIDQALAERHGRAR